MLRDAFTEGRDGTVPRTWCPLCLSRYQDKHSRLTLGCMIFILAMLPVLTTVSAPGAMTSAYFVFTAAWLTSVIMSLPHELGHALAGRCVGFAPVSIVLGDGKLLFDRVLFGVRLRIGQRLRGGATHLDVRDAPYFKARLITALAAGPAVNLLAALAAYIGWRNFDLPSLGWREMVIGFGIGNLLLAVGNLWPRAVRAPGGLALTDGAQILGQVVDEGITLQERRAGIHMLRAMYAYHDRDFEHAKQETAAALPLVANPDTAAEVLALRAESFSESGDPRAAIELLRPALEREDMSPWAHAHLDQAYAWAVLLADESVLMEDALARVSRGVELTPWSDVVLIKHVCLLAVTAATNPEILSRARLEEARRGLQQLRDFKLNGESVGYAALARGLVAAAGNEPAQARAEYNAAKNASVSPAALAVLERRLANP